MRGKPELRSASFRLQSNPRAQELSITTFDYEHLICPVDASPK